MPKWLIKVWRDLIWYYISLTVRRPAAFGLNHTFTYIIVCVYTIYIYTYDQPLMTGRSLEIGNVLFLIDVYIYIYIYIRTGNVLQNRVNGIMCNKEFNGIITWTITFKISSYITGFIGKSPQHSHFALKSAGYVIVIVISSSVLKIYKYQRCTKIDRWHFDNDQTGMSYVLSFASWTKTFYIRWGPNFSP